jgi:HEPN domain-containing protein
MDVLDLERAERLLRSARGNLELGNIAGIAGISYQAIESAATFLIEMVNGQDPAGHSGRRARASELLKICKSELDGLWRVRNVDFYGNEMVGRPKRRITIEEAIESLEAAERVLDQVREMTAIPMESER